MQCPIDGTTLVMTERAGVEIDYCPQCRGVWLDRGELDKIVERSGQTQPGPAPQERQGEGRAAHGGQPAKRKKRGGFLEELFDF